MVFQLPSQRSGLNMKKRSGKSGDIPMLFILSLITFTMLFASMSRASGAPVFEVEAICRTAIASIMGRDPKMMQVTLTTGDVLLLTYVRPIDNFVWNYRCRIEGNRVLWASEPGRWRDDSKDEKSSSRLSAVASNSALLKIMATDRAQTSCSIAIRFYEGGQPILRKVMSPMGVKNRRYGASAVGPFAPGWRTSLCIVAVLRLRRIRHE